MRQCPRCLDHFADDLTMCPEDGALLGAPDALLGTVVAGQYRIDSRIGRGGQGSVYRAKQLSLNRDIALKVVHGEYTSRPNSIERFMLEARALALIKHPGIVTIFDLGTTEDLGSFIVMEYLEGRSLRAELGLRTRLPVAMAASLMQQVCLAVHAAHKVEVIHRDLKPDNIMLEPTAIGDLRARVLDFGVAKLRDAGESASPSVTADGFVVGTPFYMSPELCEGGEPDERSDVYSLGCVFYEMLTGRVPFDGTSLIDVLNSHIGSAPTPPTHYIPEVGERLERVVLQALAKKPDDRFGSALEMAESLTALSARGFDLSDLTETGDFDVSNAPTADAIPVVRSHRPSEPTVAIGIGTNLEIEKRTSNLPEELTSFVGRQQQVDAIRDLLETSRLVTLTGPGGGGKTRLSLKVAGGLVRSFRDGVWLVELAPLRDGALVSQTVASELGVREDAGRSLQFALEDVIGSKQMLLVLDNCEHLVEDCARFVIRMLKVAPDLRILATSQEALNVPGETVHFVPPLELPSSGDVLSADAGDEFESIGLFVERARIARGDFALTADNASTIAEICRRLDGIPLAVELAAARTRTLSVDEILSRLSDRFALLNRGARSAEPRQRTLQGAMDWSYDLLSPIERLAFDRLSIFVGGFTLEAAESVIAFDELEQADVLDTLARLVEKSLIIVDTSGPLSRNRMLETVRQHGYAKLVASGDEARARASHRDYFVRYAADAELHLSGPDQSVWLERLDRDIDNLRLALAASDDAAGTGERLLGMAAALGRFWYVRNFDREGLGILDTLLDSAASANPRVRAKALLWCGSLSRLGREYTQAQERLGESYALYESIDDKAGMANATNNIGFVEQWQGEIDHAEETHMRALSHARHADDEAQIATSLNNLGVCARYRGDFEAALGLFDESLALYRRTGDVRQIAGTLSNLGVMSGVLGDFDRSAALFEESLALRRELGERRAIAAALNNLGETMQRRGDHHRAAKVLREGLRLYERAGDKRGVAIILESLVGLAASRGDDLRALKLADATSMLRESIGSPLSDAEAQDLAELVAGIRKRVDTTTADGVIAQARAMTFDALIDYALRGA